MGPGYGKTRGRPGRPPGSPSINRPRAYMLLGPTPRMLQFAALVAAGKRNKQIARIFGITTGSVRSLGAQTFQRIGVCSRLELALWYMGKFEPARPEPGNALAGVFE